MPTSGQSEKFHRILEANFRFATTTKSSKNTRFYSLNTFCGKLFIVRGLMTVQSLEQQIFEKKISWSY